MNKYFQLLIIIAISLLLSACQADEEKSVVLPVVQEKTAISVAPKLPEEPLEKPVHSGQKKVAEETVEQQDLRLEEPPPSIDLNLSDEFLKKLDGDQNLASDPLEQVAKETAQGRKIKVSGGVSFDQENGDPLEKVDGGKVKISIPLN